MKEALRNIWRRKARSALTIFGVAIGIFALATLSSLATNLNTSLQTVLDYYGSRVIVTGQSAGSAGEGGSFAQGGQVPLDLGDRLRLIDGVDKAYPTITLAAAGDQPTGFGPPPLIYAYRPSDAATDPKKLKLRAGRELRDEDTSKVVIGTNVAQEKKVKPGDKVALKGRDFEVVGVLERTGGTPDKFYIVTLTDAQEFVRAGSVFNPSAGNFVTDFNVIPKAGVSPDDLARTITAKIRGVRATPPGDFKKQVEQGFLIFNLIVLGSALIAVVVGSLSVINTMVMSVAERQKEIGIKRVVGAKTRHILKEYMTETAAMGGIGGILGVLGGWVLTTIINGYTAKNGITIFTLTPTLAVQCVLFAIALGVVAGIYPAARAARVKPVKVLREE